MYGEDGEKSKQGGCLTITSYPLPINKLLQYSNGVCELQITWINPTNILLINIYRPPDSSLAKFNDIILKVTIVLDETEKENPNIYITGDFNFPPDVVEWKKVDEVIIPVVKPGKTKIKLAYESLQKLVDHYFLLQIIDLPTRKDHILDLCFTNDTLSIASIESVIIPQFISDHNMIRIKTLHSTQKEEIKANNKDTPTIATFNFAQSNHTILEDKLKLFKWDEIMNVSTRSPAELTNVLTAKVIEAASDANIPKYIKGAREDGIPRRRRKLFRKRCKLQTALTKDRTNTAIQEKLNIVNRDIQQSYVEQNIQNEEKVIGKIKDDPKIFYKYANSKRKVRHRIGPLCTTIGANKHIEHGEYEMAEILSKQYKSVFTEPIAEKKVLYPEIFFNSDKPQNIICLENIYFTIQDIEDALNETKPNSTSGPDGWPAYLLHHYKHQLSGPIYNIWRKSLDSGDMPEPINLSHITPIFKGGMRCEAVNYRPIALTSHLTKVFERVVRKAIITHLATNNFLNPTQHGFVTKRSTLTQLIGYYQQILDLLEKHGTVEAIYLDFEKAFDKCDHGVILHKLKAYGICGKLGIWLHHFITQRQQSVCVMGSKSSNEWVTSGVPQGSVLGPLLFSILISDINEGITGSLLLSYADDTKMYKGISAAADEERLQQDLSVVYKWAEDNNQTFNKKKFESIQFTLDRYESHYTNPVGQIIENKASVVDLGIQLSQDCKFDLHITTVVTKGKKLAGWILRTFDCRDKLPMLTLLKSLVIPTMEYCCPLWSPTDQYNIKSLEQIQRSFTKRIEGFSEVHYWDRLKQLRILSLERRRDRYTIIYIWKVLHNFFPNPGFNIQSIDRNDGIMLTLPQNHAPATIRNLKERSILYNGVRLFRSLPSHLRKLQYTIDNKPPSTESYKRSLDKYLHTLPDEPYSSKRQRRSPTNNIIDQKVYRDQI